MNLKDIKYFYFLGIGGIGMSALARYFKAMGKDVSGYDKTQTKLTDEIIKEGINIHFEDNIKKIQPEILNFKDETIIIYTPAVPKDHSEYQFFNANGFNIKKRSEVLGMITQDTYTIAVAGTHGKTTTSTLIAHILKSSGVDCSAFLGGISLNYNTNLLLNQKSEISNPKSIVVVEADEYDRSFLTLHPSVAVITSVDADHLDIYGNKKEVEESYFLFSEQVKPEGTLIVKKTVDNTLSIKRKKFTYSLTSNADYTAKNIVVKNGEYHYDIVYPQGEINNVVIGLPGKHNVENSVAAVAVAKSLEISDDSIKKALSSFKGVKRRFEYHIKNENLVYIDDYAHHPEELKACIKSVREMYPEKKITGIFQPHLFSRTRDFADEFARSLELLDELILMEIYPARELPMEGITSQWLLEKVNLKNKMVCAKKDLVSQVASANPEVIITLGAGDIDTFVTPIKNKLLGIN